MEDVFGAPYSNTTTKMATGTNHAPGHLHSPPDHFAHHPPALCLELHPSPDDKQKKEKKRSRRRD